MIAHLKAVKALLEAQGRPVHLIDATGETSFPYYLVWPSTGAPGADAPLDQNADLSFLVGVTAVGQTVESAGIVARNGKALLGPTKSVPLTVAGRRASGGRGRRRSGRTSTSGRPETSRSATASLPALSRSTARTS
jgi:hypothetical protein